MQLPSSCVVDASVGIKLFLEDKHSEEVHELFRQSAMDPRGSLFVPDLFFVECANILWKMVRFASYPTETAVANLAGLGELLLIPTPTAKLTERALEIALHYGITAYDACYLALSEQTAVPLVTADDRLVSKLSASHFAIVGLTDVP